MRRLVPFALAALLTIGLAFPVSAAGRPEMFDNEPIEQLFANSCDFPVALQDTAASGKFFEFPVDRKGNQKSMATGGYTSVLWNTEHPEISIEITYHGRLEFVVHPDDTMSVTVSGQALHWFDDATDAAMYGLTPGLYLITGKVKVLTDLDFIALEPATIRGARIRDLCAELTPPE
jgi:hypothetical protein